MRLPTLAMACCLPLAFSACTTTPHHVSASPPGTTSPDRASGVVDPVPGSAEYIARVNAEARRRGLLVEWINPPKRAPVRR